MICKLLSYYTENDFYKAFEDHPRRNGKRTENEHRLATWIFNRRGEKKKGSLDPNLEGPALSALFRR